MSRLATARRCALACVSERRRRDGRMREILRAAPQMASLSAADRALASRLAFGVVSTQGVLDAQIDALLRRGSSLEPRVRDALRVAAFEIAYLSTPDAVAVSQGVELVRTVSPRAAGLANAILRRMARELRPQVAAARAAAAQGSASCAELALTGGLPLWLVELIFATRGSAAACDLSLAQLEPAPVFVAVNRCRHGVAEGRALLERAGLDPATCGPEGSFALGKPAGLAASGLVGACDVVVSDLAAQLVARLALPAEGGRVLELGQGRGTKTLLMASAAAERGSEARFVGVESVASKVAVCHERMATAGLGERVRCLTLDGRRLADPGLGEPLDGGFDAVLLDAPCSGTGTMRRHPEIAWSLRSEDVAEAGTLPSLQLQLLEAASAQLRPGGLLAYATCSVLPTEDEQVVEAFLAGERGRAFERVPLPVSRSAQDRGCVDADGSVSGGEQGLGVLFGDDARRAARVTRDSSGQALLTLPQPQMPDGHYCAMLRRVSA